MVGVEEYRTNIGTAESVFYCVKILYYFLNPTVTSQKSNFAQSH